MRIVHHDAASPKPLLCSAPSLILVLPMLSDDHTAGQRIAMTACAEDAAAVLDVPLYILGAAMGAIVKDADISLAGVPDS